MTIYWKIKLSKSRPEAEQAGLSQNMGSMWFLYSSASICNSHKLAWFLPDYKQWRGKPESEETRDVPIILSEPELLTREYKIFDLH